MLARYLSLISIFICGAIGGSAQCGVTNDTLFVETYDDLWAITSCDSIWGSLYIQNWDFSNLDSLQNLVWVEEHLIIDQCTSLLEVDGLSALEEVGGNLWIRNNFTLQFLDGLNSLVQVGGDILVKGNITLVDINGFSQLQLIPGDLKLQENHTLEALSGLQNVEWVGGDVLIEGQNIVLDDLSGLSALTQIEGDLFIALPQGTSLDGLEALNTVGGDLSIMNMLILGNIDGLSALQSIGGNCEVGNNGSLVQIDGFSNLTSVGGDLYIHDNPSLFLCCGIEPVILADGVGGILILENNTNACNDEESILASCADAINDHYSGDILWTLKGNALTLNAAKNSWIRIFDSSGRCVFAENLQQGESRLLEMHSGLYFLLPQDARQAERVVVIR